MKSRWQALQLCLDTVVVIVVQVIDQFSLEVLHGLEFLQIEQLTFEQTEEILHHCIVQTVTLSAHTLPDTLVFQHLLILCVLVVPSLVRMKNQPCPIWNCLKASESMVVTMLRTGRSEMM